MDAVWRREAAVARGVAALALAGAALGLVLAGVSAFPYDQVAPRLDALAWDGHAEPFTPDFFAALVWRLRATGAACLVAAVAAWRHRAALARGAARALAALRAASRALARDAVRAWRATPRAERGAALALCAGGAALRAAFLFHPLRRDEAFTFNNFVSQPWLVALSNTAPYYGNNNHLANTALAKLSCALFGGDPWALRLPAAVAGALLVPAVYAAGRLVYGRGAALLAAALVATSPALVARATDARGYAAVMLAAVVCWACAARGLRRPGDPAAWTLFALAAAGGFYAVPTMLLPFGGIALWFVLAAWRPADGRRARLLELGASTAAAAALTLGLYTPALAVSGAGSLTDNHWVQPWPWARFAAGWAQRGPELLALFTGDPVLPVGGVLLAGLGVATVFHRRIGRQRVSLVGPLAGWCAVLVGVQRVVPWTRVWSFALPLLLLVASGGLAAAAAGLARPLRGRSQRWAAALPVVGTALVLALAAASAPELLRGDRIFADAESGRVLPLADAASFVAPLLRPGDRVVSEGAPGLVYELTARGVPPDRFLTPGGSGRRLFVLAADPAEVSRRLVENDIPERAFTPPRLLARFEHYTPVGWYALERRAAPGS